MRGQIWRARLTGSTSCCWLAATHFVFARPLPGVPDGESVIAGYPWFSDWGRDTMIALPGLTLATGGRWRRPILETFARFVERGHAAERFPGRRRPEYNTVDARSGIFEAWRAYVDATGDEDALRDCYPVLPTSS